jgi:hypothetical protein
MEPHVDINGCIAPADEDRRGSPRKIETGFLSRVGAEGAHELLDFISAR